MSDEYVTKSNANGEKDTFSTGYQRDSRKGKGRYDLLPLRAIDRVAKLYERGAEKYGDRNFAKGAPFSRVSDSALRHLMQWMRGDRSEDHLAAVMWNVGQIMEYEADIENGSLSADLDDMSNRYLTTEARAVLDIIGGPAHYLDKGNPPNVNCGWIVGDKWENRTTGDIYVWNGTEWVKQ